MRRVKESKSYSSALPTLSLSLSLSPSPLLSLPLSLTRDFGRGGVGCEGEGVVSLLVPLLALKFNRRNPSESRRLNFFILLSFPLRVTGGETGPGYICACESERACFVNLCELG